jgi:lysophospholipase L1-like esterase
MPVLISPPVPHTTPEDFPIYHFYASKVSEVARERNVLFIPAAAEFARRESAGEQLYLDWVHPNAAGHRVIADLLVHYLVPLLSAAINP